MVETFYLLCHCSILQSTVGDTPFMLKTALSYLTLKLILWTKKWDNCVLPSKLGGIPSYHFDYPNME